MSRTPIREAMVRLEADGFIAKAPYKGSLVRGVDLDYVEEVFALRVTLEGLGARLAARNRSLEDLHEIEGLLERAHAEADEHDWDWEADVNDRFHLLIPEAGGAIELARLLAPLLRHSERFLMMFRVDLGLRQVEHSHLEMVRRIAAGDQDGAERAVHAHLLEVFAVMMRGRLRFDECRFLPAILSDAELTLVAGYLDTSSDGADSQRVRE